MPLDGGLFPPNTAAKDPEASSISLLPEAPPSWRRPYSGTLWCGNYGDSGPQILRATAFSHPPTTWILRATALSHPPTTLLGTDGIFRDAALAGLALAGLQLFVSLMESIQEEVDQPYTYAVWSQTLPKL